MRKPRSLVEGPATSAGRRQQPDPTAEARRTRRSAEVGSPCSSPPCSSALLRVLRVSAVGLGSSSGGLSRADQVKDRLTPREVAHALAVEPGVLLELDLHLRRAPLGYAGGGGELDRVGGVRIERVVARPRHATLLVPQPD